MTACVKLIRTLFIVIVACLGVVACGSDDGRSNGVASDGVASSNELNAEVSVDTEAQFERDYSPVLGPEDAAVTIVEFFDPACEACRAFYPYVKEMMKRHPEDVRLVIRYAAFHDGSETVIRLLEAARRQGVYQNVLESLLIKQEEWASHHNPDIDRAWVIAEEAGLDVEAARAILNSSALNTMIAQEDADIRAFKVNKTPTFYVNGKTLEKHGPDHLYRLIVSELDNDKD